MIEKYQAKMAVNVNAENVLFSCYHNQAEEKTFFLFSVLNLW